MKHQHEPMKLYESQRVTPTETSFDRKRTEIYDYDVALNNINSISLTHCPAIG